MEKLIDFDGTLYEVVKNEILIAKMNSIFNLDESKKESLEFEKMVDIFENEILTVK